jgi:hypothetical protein
MQWSNLPTFLGSTLTSYVGMSLMDFLQGKQISFDWAWSNLEPEVRMKRKHEEQKERERSKNKHNRMIRRKKYQ